MEQLCRVCRDGTVNLVEIFANQSASQQQDEPSLADMLNECTSCEFHRNDDLPQKICISCVLAAQHAFRFKRKCEESHQHFRQLLSKSYNTDVWIKQEQSPENVSWQEELHAISDSCAVKPVFVDCDVKFETDCSSSPNEQPAKDSHVCPTCGKEFISQRSLSLHTRQCTLVTKLANSGNLLEPMRPRTVERPHKCPHCVKAFTQRGRLTEHIRSHTGERPYRCLYCPKTFARAGNLADHKRIHTGERPYACTQCHAAFNQAGALHRHLRIHPREDT